MVGVAIQDQSLIVLVTRKETIAAFEVHADNFTELVTNAEVGIPILQSLALEMIEVIPNATVVVGQVAMVDGETSVSLDVPIPFNRFRLFLAFLSKHAHRKHCHDDQHQQFRKS